MRIVCFVVYFKFGRPAHSPAVQRMAYQVLDGDDDGLLHLVAHHLALVNLADAPLLRRGGPGCLHLVSSLLSVSGLAPSPALPNGTFTWPPAPSALSTPPRAAASGC